MMNGQSEADFLQSYKPGDFERPNCTVDMAIFTVLEAGLHVLTVKRDAHPFLGSWALVGGFVDVNGDESLEATARRKLKEKTGVTTPYLEQYGTIGNKTRDPRGWSITTVYFALIPSSGLVLKAGSGASEICWAKISGAGVSEALAFDHAALLAGCLERLRGKVLYTSLPVHLMPPAFTLGELQKVYELILDTRLEHKSFRRRMLGAGILEETGEFKHEAKRPSQLYRAKEKLSTHFFVRNLESTSSAYVVRGQE